MATIGVCIFCAVTSVAALFIFIDRKDEKQMKKTIAILLALCLCIGLCACGGNSDPTEPTKSAEAQKADELILAIGEVSLESESAILAAKAYYDTLTDGQKAQVENVTVLETAVADLDTLKKEGEYKATYEKAVKYETNLQIDEAYAEYGKLPVDYKDVAQRMDTLKPYVGVVGTWVCDTDTAISNKGETLSMAYRKYKFSFDTGTDIADGYVAIDYDADPGADTNNSLFKGNIDYLFMLLSGDLTLKVENQEDGSRIIGVHNLYSSKMGTLLITYSITAEGKLLVKTEAKGTSVTFSYTKE